MNEKFVIIMAGGVGSRFWPLSRQEKPKQFLDILGTGESFLQQTYRRFSTICPPENIFIVTNSDYKNLVLEQLNISPNNVLSEPFRRNTAPCLAYGAFKIFKKNQNAVIAITPADHYIAKEQEYAKELEESMNFAKDNDALLTLGIKPDRPETGYGYIQADRKKAVKNIHNLLKVKTFTEKPDITLATMFLQSGDFFWNSGVFISNIKTLLAAYEKFLPDMYAAFDDGKDYYNTDKEQAFIDKTYTECRNISIDYGIMEKAENVYVKCVDFGWSDVGTWGSLYEHTQHDPEKNAIISGKIFSYNNKNCLISVSPEKIAIIQGLENYIVVESNDALLIVSKDHEQNIRQYLDEIKHETKNKYI